MAYIAHGYLLGTHRRGLFDDPITASEYGPVIISVYDHFKSFGDTFVEIPNVSELKFSFSAESDQVMLFVVKTYGAARGMDLTNLTCQEDTPWHGQYKEPDCSTIITNRSIRLHYLKVISNPESVNGL